MTNVTDNYTLHTPELYSEELRMRLFQAEKHWMLKGSNAAQTMAEIAAREAARSPTAYLRFGVYWWGLKRVLIGRGLLSESMTTDDAMVRSVYSASDDSKTIVLAFIFREWHDATQFAGNRETATNNDGFTYTLIDLELEIPA
jgi:hypothetical protein